MIKENKYRIQLGSNEESGKIKKTTWINPVAAIGVNSAYSLEVWTTSCRKRHREYAVRLAAKAASRLLKFGNRWFEPNKTKRNKNE